MRFYTKQHQFYCGIDLHADAMYICILNAVGEIVVHNNIPTKPKAFLRLIKPYREGLIVGCECMFTWYWLADFCADEGINFVLGHALYMRAIHGGKAKNDKIDSHKIAVLLRGGTFPLAYAYPAKMRATRDLLLRRNHLARKRAELIAHIQNTASQYNLPDPLGCIAKPSQREGLPQKFKDPIVRGMVEIDLATIEHYDQLLGVLERQLEKVAMSHDPVSLALLKSIPGWAGFFPWLSFTKLRISPVSPVSRTLSPTAGWSSRPRNQTGSLTAIPASGSAMLTCAGPLEKPSFSCSKEINPCSSKAR